MGSLEPLLSRYLPFDLAEPPLNERWCAIANAIIAIVFLIAFPFGSWRDDALTLHGSAVGLFEHPGIWIYLIAQPFLPFALARAVSRLKTLPADTVVLESQFRESALPHLLQNLENRLCRKTKLSAAVYACLLVLGFGIWTRNTFQLQNPIASFGFDCWDSRAHFWGFWLTRAYKAYIAVGLAPALIHAQWCVVACVRELLSEASRANALAIDPYAEDGAGGTRVFIDTILNPMIPILLAASLMSVAASIVHEKYDLTTVGGLVITCGLFLLVYVVPAITLRGAILAEKNRQKVEICKLQSSLYAGLPAGDMLFTKDATAVIRALSDIVKQIDDLPNWPQIDRAWRLVAVALSSKLVTDISKSLLTYVRARLAL